MNRRTGRRLAATVVLPSEHVKQHVDLGYAITAHRAQGITVDTAHVVASAATTRENLYVSMTRGRASNVANVALDQPDDSHATPEVEDVTRASTPRSRPRQRSWPSSSGSARSRSVAG